MENKDIEIQLKDDLVKTNDLFIDGVEILDDLEARGIHY